MILISAQPNELKYVWEVNLYLESVKNIGWEENVHVLVYVPPGKGKLNTWDIVEKLYPKAKFFYYTGDFSVENIKKVYIPIIRPFCLKEHWKNHPELEKETIFYTDSDIIFTKRPNIEKFLDDNICYLSNTVFPHDYMSHKYFDSKVNQVIPDKLDEYKKRDILKECALQVGIDKQTIINNYLNTGGAQYLLKGIRKDFWDRVYESCITLRLHLVNVNSIFYQNEDQGYQSWCADMWAVLWNIWKDGKNTFCPKELDFAWATDRVNKLKQVSILHNAGITSESTIRVQGTKEYVDLPAFYKGKFEYNQGMKTPFRDLEYLNNIVENNKDFCTGIYAKHILDVQSKYKLNY